MIKPVMRYKVRYYNCRAGTLSYLGYSDKPKPDDEVDDYDVPAELVSAKDYDSLKACYDTLLKACKSISTGLMKHSAPAIAYEALKAVGEADEA